MNKSLVCSSCSVRAIKHLGVCCCRKMITCLKRAHTVMLYCLLILKPFKLGKKPPKQTYFLMQFVFSCQSLPGAKQTCVRLFHISSWVLYSPDLCIGFFFFFYQVPNYYKIIKNPMDLNLVKRKLQLKHTQHYQSPKEFVYDVRLVFSNCAKYNEVSGSMSTPAKGLGLGCMQGLGWWCVCLCDLDFILPYLQVVLDKCITKQIDVNVSVSESAQKAVCFAWVWCTVYTRSFVTHPY